MTHSALPIVVPGQIYPLTHQSRTLAQFEAVRSIISDPEFLHMVSPDMFSPDVGSYRGPFAFLYYTRDGVLHAIRIGARGQHLQHVTA